jgi:endonuclease YncB( thermonuclease family)
MPFYLIKGSFHVVGRNKNGTATGFQPDGDSIQFKPDNPALLDKLEQVTVPYTLTGIGSLNLRFEGIDAVEIHYQGARQPSPFPEAARNSLTADIGLDPINYSQTGVTVKPPAVHDGQRGHIFSRSLDAHGRPVSFVYKGDPDPGEADGTEVFLKVDRLKKSLNWQQLADGEAYPLFYDTLFSDLRNALVAESNAAKAAQKGIWKKDVQASYAIASRADAEAAQLLYPKVFRRLADFFREQDDLANLPAWMTEKSENDEVWVLPEWSRTHFDNVLDIQAGTIKLKRSPSDLVFVSRK